MDATIAAEQYAKPIRPAAGQRSMFKEEDHPRDDAGKFSVKHGDIVDIPASFTAGPFKAQVSDLPSGLVGLRRVGGEPGLGSDVAMERDSVPRFLGDLGGRIQSEYRSNDADVNAVLDGKAKYLGRGQDGLAFDAGNGNVVKASSEVGFHWNNGLRSPAEGSNIIRRQVVNNEKLRAAGVPGLLPQRLVEHDGRSYAVMPKVDTTSPLTEDHLQQVADTVKALHEHGYSIGDDIQPGIGSDGKAYIYDTGAVKKLSDGGPHRAWDIQDDESRLSRLWQKHGKEFFGIDPLQKYQDQLKHVTERLDSHVKRGKPVPIPQIALWTKSLEDRFAKLGDQQVWMESEHPQIMERLKGIDPTTGVIQYAKHKPAAGQRSLWNEEDHPRGQPENAGEFASKPGAKSPGAPKPTPQPQSTPASTAASTAASTPAPLDAATDYKQNGTRAKAFKAWFGDWENDPANASKVVDPKTGEPQETTPFNGEGSKVVKDGKPVAVYHGTAKGGFESFDKSKIGESNLWGPGFYFTEDRDVAETYTDKDSNERSFPKLHQVQMIEAKLEDMLPGGWLLRTYSDNSPQHKGQTRLLDPDGREHQLFLRDGKTAMIHGRDLYESIPESLKFTEEQKAEWHNTLKSNGIEWHNPEVKNVFLNIRKPFDLDERHDAMLFKDAHIAADRMFPESKPGSREWAMRDVAAKRLKDAFRNMQEGHRWSGQDIYHVVKQAIGEPRTSQFFQSMGWDGLTHVGGDRMGGGYHHRVWIAFEPNQIKSVDNQGTFNAGDNRINYSRRFEEAFERYARVKPAAGQRGMFDEADHPRGQPENAGQFAPKGGGATAVAEKSHEPTGANPLEERVMGYKEFVAAGNKDSDWDSYREQQNAKSKTRATERLFSRWNAGDKLGGNDIVNLLRGRGIATPQHIAMSLQHDDTTVSKTSVNGKFGRGEARKIHQWVSESMQSAFPQAEMKQAAPVDNHAATVAAFEAAFSKPNGGGRDGHDPAHKAVADRFGIPPEVVANVASTPVDELRRRDAIVHPSNTAAPTTDHEQFPLHSAKIASWQTDPHNAYVSFRRDMDPKQLTPSEPEDGIKKTSTYQDYVNWAKQGSVAPPADVAEADNGSGTVLSSNRRRVLAAQDAGVKSVPTWFGAHNKETGNGLKYGDIMRAVEEEKAKGSQPAKPATPAPLWQPKMFDAEPSGQKTMFDAGIEKGHGKSKPPAQKSAPSLSLVEQIEEQLAKQSAANKPLPQQKGMFSRRAQQTPGFVARNLENLTNHGATSRATMRDGQTPVHRYRQPWDESKHPRDENGRFSESHAQSHVASGKAFREWTSQHAVPALMDRGYGQVEAQQIAFKAAQRVHRREKSEPIQSAVKEAVGILNRWSGKLPPPAGDHGQPSAPQSAPEPDPIPDAPEWFHQLREAIDKRKFDSANVSSGTTDSANMSSDSQNGDMNISPGDESDDIPDIHFKEWTPEDGVESAPPPAVASLPGAAEPLSGLHQLPNGHFVGSTQMHVNDLKVDPKRFQYKFVGVGEDGVTKELKDAKRFNPMLGGQLLVWRDPQDGQTYVINGHHRFELAKRSLASNSPDDSWNGNLSVYFIDADSPATARALGAVTNIAEGRGTAVDAAKFLRDTNANLADLEQHGVSAKGAMARDAVPLSKLSPRIWQKVAQETVTPSRGLAIAKHLGGDPDAQDQLFSIVEQREQKTGKDIPDSHVEEMAREMSMTPKHTESDGGLFGDFFERSLLPERANLKAAVRRAIMGEKNAFAAVSSTRRAGTLQSEGRNTLDTEGNREKAQQSARQLEDFEQQSNWAGHPIAAAVNEAAQRLANEPRKAKSIEKQLIDHIRGLLTGGQSVNGGDQLGTGRQAMPIADSAGSREGEPERHSRGFAGRRALTAMFDRSFIRNV